MVGNFIGMSDIVNGDIASGSASGAYLPEPKNKRIWIMIVKVNEPNNCTKGGYGGGPDNYFSGRTMYRYYRCMPIYQNGVIGTPSTILQAELQLWIMKMVNMP